MDYKAVICDLPKDENKTPTEVTDYINFMTDLSL